MADHLFVAPGELRAAVTSVAAARQSLDSARGALDASASRTRETLGADGRAAHKYETFTRQWRSEFELIADMLGAFTEILEQAAGCYRELDGAFARSLDDAVAGG